MKQQDVLNALKNQCKTIHINYRIDNILDSALFESNAMKDFIIYIRIGSVQHRLFEKDHRFYRSQYRLYSITWISKDTGNTIDHIERTVLPSFVKLLKAHHLIT